MTTKTPPLEPPEGIRDVVSQSEKLGGNNSLVPKLPGTAVGDPLKDYLKQGEALNRALKSIGSPLPGIAIGNQLKDLLKPGEVLNRSLKSIHNPLPQLNLLKDILKPGEDLNGAIKSIYNPLPQLNLLKDVLKPGEELNRALKSISSTSENSALLSLGSKESSVAYKQPDPRKLNSPSDLGAFIKSVRKSKGLTQQQFADLAGVGRRFVVECEAGKPRLEFAKVLQVAAAAGIDIIAQKR